MKCESTNNSYMGEIIYKELSYTINGILFQVQNDLGKYCNEKQVCDKIEFYFKEKNVPYQREYILPPSFDGEKTGRNRVDFLIDDKIILEIKCKRFLVKDDYFQTQRYLHALNKKLGILVNFRDDRIKPRRVLNSLANS